MKDRIKQLMESQHMNQQSFASYIGVAPATLSSILRERTRPTLDTVDSICRKMPNVNLTWLVNGTGEMFLPKPTQQPGQGQGTDGMPGAMGAGTDDNDGVNDPSATVLSGSGASAYGGSGAAYGGSGSAYGANGAPSSSSPTPSANAADQSRGGANPAVLGISFGSGDNPSPQNTRAAHYGGQRRMPQRQEEYYDGGKKVDKPTRRITEIRVFYDDQTWESFVPKK